MMCGIFGYIGKKDVMSVMLNALKKLEYRGYDSAGIAIISSKLSVYKNKGRIEDLEKTLPRIEGHLGIGHTRWATHGKPSNVNAHPHISGNIAIVHNGIIENYQELKERLEADKFIFISETDSEVIAHLVNYYYNNSKLKCDLLQSVKNTVSELKGSYAILVVCEDSPNLMVAAKKESPLIIGIGENENLVASDVSALLKYTRRVVYLEDYDVIVIKKDKIEPMKASISVVEWDEKVAEKAGYEHFMLKEIHEQPTSILETLRATKLNLDPCQIIKIDNIRMIGCGSAYNAALYGKYLFENLTGISTIAEVASEFRYSSPRLDEKTLVIALSQSGETADSLSAIKKAKSYGCKTLAITNVVGSAITKEVSDVLYTGAGPEIAVLSTKTFTTQLTSLYLLAVYIGRICYKIKEKEEQSLAGLKKVPEQIKKILEKEKKEGLIQKCALRFANSSNYFFIGRGINYPIAMEGALKLKEVSYIHAEGYPAGELKHGPIALISGIPVVVIATSGQLISNIKEVKARDGWIIAISNESDTEIEKHADTILKVPDADHLISPILSSVVLQLLAYYTAKARSCDIDKPKNLAKTVTVE